MPEPYLRAYLHWNHCHSDAGSKSIKEKSPNVFFWEDVADHIESLFQERERSCSVRLGFVSKIVAGRCIVLKTTPASFFIYYTCINIQCKWVLGLVFELLLWSSVMKLRNDMIFLLYLCCTSKSEIVLPTGDVLLSELSCCNVLQK